MGPLRSHSWHRAYSKPKPGEKARVWPRLLKRRCCLRHWEADRLRCSVFSIFLCCPLPFWWGLGQTKASEITRRFATIPPGKVRIRRGEGKKKVHWWLNHLKWDTHADEQPSVFIRWSLTYAVAPSRGRVWQCVHSAFGFGFVCAEIAVPQIRR